MTLRCLHQPLSGQMRVAGLMSGKGSNILKLLEYQRHLESTQGSSPYMIAVLFTDYAHSNAVTIGRDYDIPVIVRDKIAFYATRNAPLTDMKVREEFDTATVQALSGYGIHVAAFGGYMSIATKPLLKAFIGVNVHPANLSIMQGEKRAYTGSKAVKKAILAGEKELRATTHILEEKVDYGKIFMISAPLQVYLPAGFDRNNPVQVQKVVDEHQEQLKSIGDWVIFPKTLEALAKGKYAYDAVGNLYYEGAPIPNGVRLEAAA